MIEICWTRVSLELLEWNRHSAVPATEARFPRRLQTQRRGSVQARRPQITKINNKRCTDQKPDWMARKIFTKTLTKELGHSCADLLIKPKINSKILITPGTKPSRLAQTMKRIFFTCFCSHTDTAPRFAQWSRDSAQPLRLQHKRPSNT